MWLKVRVESYKRLWEDLREEGSSYVKGIKTLDIHSRTHIWDLLEGKLSEVEKNLTWGLSQNKRESCYWGYKNIIVIVNLNWIMFSFNAFNINFVERERKTLEE
jgi:hypothetical protein